MMSLKNIKKLLSAILAFVFILSSVPYKAEAGVEWAHWGTAVHGAVTLKFQAENSSLGNTTKCGKKIPGTGFYGIVAKFPDLVLDRNGSSITDIYELKPSSYRTGDKLTSAKNQLSGYISAYNSSQAYPTRIPRAGTSWNPQGQIVPVPRANKAVILSTMYTLNPGLVFYDFVNYKTNPTLGISPVPARDASGQQYTVFAREPQKGYVLAYAYIGGAVIVVVGTLVADVLTAGVSAADDPASFAAAAMLVQRGLAAMPAHVMEQFKSQYEEKIPEEVIEMPESTIDESQQGSSQNPYINEVQALQSSAITTNFAKGILSNLRNSFKYLKIG